MVIIRPIAASDFDDLFQISKESGHGFTSLPENEELLHNKIALSEKSFSSEVKTPGEESYLWVMEDNETGEIVGTSGIIAAVGLDSAFYNYHMSKVVHSSRELNIYKSVDILTLSNDYTGNSEICTLFLRKNARKDNNGKFLSRFRFLFIAEHPTRFSDTVFAEMRGVSDENGNSPFWEWLQEHFFSIDFPTADYLSGIGNKVFIAELMPKYPIYTSLLSKEAQKVIGQVHDKTRPALQLLKSDGFNCNGYIDIFDAGPAVEANVRNIRTVQQSRHYQVKAGDAAQGSEHMVINTEVANFRATKCKLFVDEVSDTAIIEPQVLEALRIADGDTIRACSLT